LISPQIISRKTIDYNKWFTNRIESNQKLKAINKNRIWGQIYRFCELFSKVYDSFVVSLQIFSLIIVQ